MVTKTAYVVYTNSDLTEGRGHEYPKHVCETLTTARRLAKRNYVQGMDCPITTVEIVNQRGCWIGPVHVIPPTKEDIEAEKLINEAREINNKKKALIEKIEESVQLLVEERKLLLESINKENSNVK